MKHAMVAACAAICATGAFIAPAFAERAQGEHSDRGERSRGEHSGRGENSGRGEHSGRGAMGERGAERRQSPQDQGARQRESRQWSPAQAPPAQSPQAQSPQAQPQAPRREQFSNRSAPPSAPAPSFRRSEQNTPTLRQPLGQRFPRDQSGLDGAPRDYGRRDDGQRGERSRDFGGASGPPASGPRDYGRRDDGQRGERSRDFAADRHRDEHGRDGARTHRRFDEHMYRDDPDRWRDARRRYGATHHDFHRPRYDSWRRVPYGGYFDYGYAHILHSYYGRNYYWWSYDGWRRPYRNWRVGYLLPAWIYWEPVPYDLYYRLPPAPYGCRYVYVDGDILLIAISTGIILDALLWASY